MGIFDRLIKSKEERRVEMRADLLDRMRGIVERKTDEPAQHSAGFLYLSNTATELLQKTAEYTCKYPDDKPLAFLGCFVAGLSAAANGFLYDNRYRDPKAEGTLVLSALVLINENPNCANEAYNLIPQASRGKSTALTVREGFSKNDELMRIYQAFWNEMVHPGLKCPISSGGPLSVRKYIQEHKPF